MESGTGTGSARIAEMPKRVMPRALRQKRDLKNGLDGVMEKAELRNRKGENPCAIPVHVTGHDAPSKKAQTATQKWTARTGSTCPDQMFQIDNNARREPGESGPRIGVAGM